MDSDYVDSEVSTKSSIESNTYTASQRNISAFAASKFPSKRIISIQEMTYDRGQLPFYLVNMDEGWAVVTSDLRLMDIVAYAEEGHLSILDLDNPGLKTWFEMKNEQYNSTILSYSADSTKETTKHVKDSLTRVMDMYFWCGIEVSRTIVSQNDYNLDHLIQTKWGQSAPWNYSCPIYPFYPWYGQRTLTGCVPVAIGQTLYYLHHYLGEPSGLYHNVGYSNPYDTSTFYRYDYEDPSPQWNTMALDSTMSNTAEVGNLLADIGRRVGTQYGVLESGTPNSNFLTTAVLYPYEISCQVDDYNYLLVRGDLENNLPVIVQAAQQNSCDGHCWIIDGYKYTKTITDITYQWTLVYCPGPEPPGPEYDVIYSLSNMQSIDPNMYDGKISVLRQESTSNDFWRMNWGYDGMYDNGFYGVTNNWTVGSSTFLNNGKIIHNFTLL